MIKRFYKFYHPKNNYFFLHIAVDTILIIFVVAILAIDCQLITSPAAEPLKNISLKQTIEKPTAVLSAKSDSEAAAQERIKRELKLSAVCRYNLPEGDQLGRGPLPPQVGVTTTYWILLSPSTDHFDVNQILVTAKLAENVNFTGRTSAVSENGVVYDETNRSISWEIDRLTRRTNTAIQPGAAFEIEFTPTEKQAGQPAKLLKNLKISGIDAISSMAIFTTLPDLTTAIPEDLSGGAVIMPLKTAEISDL